MAAAVPFHINAVSELSRLVHSFHLCCRYCRWPRYAQALIDREVAVLELAEEVREETLRLHCPFVATIFSSGLAPRFAQH